MMLGEKKSTNHSVSAAAAAAVDSTAMNRSSSGDGHNTSTNDTSTPSKSGKFNLKKMVKKFPVSMLTPGKERNKEKNGGLHPIRKSDSGRPEIADISNLDERPFDACELLFHDCEDFLKTSSKTIAFMRKTSTPASKLNVTSKINKWRAKRKENTLSVTYEALQGRVNDVELQLKAYSDQAVSSTSTLVVQALHLNVRLTSCIRFNREELEIMDPQLQSGQIYMNQLKATEVALENMISFSEVLEIMKRNQPQPYIPWAQRMAAQKEKEKQEALEKERRDQARANGEEDVELMLDPVIIQKRLRKVKRALKIVEEVMMTSMAQHRVRSMNLEHLERAQRAMLKLLERFRSTSITRATDSVYGALKLNAALVMQHQKDVDGKMTDEKDGAAGKNREGVVSVNNPLKMKNLSSSQEMKQSGVDKEDATTEVAGASSATIKTEKQASIPTKNTDGSSAARLDCVDVYKISSTESRRRSYTENQIASSAEGATLQLRETSATSLAAQSSEISPLTAEGRQFSTNSETMRRDSHMVALGPAQMETTEAVEAAVGVKEDENDAAVIRVAFQRLDNTEFEVPGATFDHNLCSDCSCVFEMANECSMRLAATKMRAKESTERLIKLEEYRERMKADAELLEHHGWDGEHEIP